MWEWNRLSSLDGWRLLPQAVWPASFRVVLWPMHAWPRLPGGDVLRDSFYRAILDSLRKGILSPGEFEALAVTVARDLGLSVVLIKGGSDRGYDGAITVLDSEPAPLVATTGEDPVGNLDANLQAALGGGRRPARSVVFATHRSLKPRERDRLFLKAQEHGFVLQQVIDEAAVAAYLYRHPQVVELLLGVIGQLPALSELPMFPGSLTDVPLVGRDKELEQLRTASSDSLLVGTSGSGKTSLLRQLTAESVGLFLASTDSHAIVNAFRETPPSAVFVDDFGDETLHAVGVLVHARAELGLDFRVIVTAWVSDPELMRALCLSSSAVLELPRLTLDETVRVVKSAGVLGPDSLIAEIVRQSDGIPGLAVSLALACLRGEAKEVVAGMLMGRATRQVLAHLVSEEEDAVEALAYFAVGGRAGLSLAAVASLLNTPPSRLRALMLGLSSSGFVAALGRDRLAVRPARLRSVLIREVFFSLPALQIEPAIEASESPADTVRALIGAAALGARIAGLRDLLEAIGDASVFETYASLGRAEVEWVLAQHPELATSVAHPALFLTPETVLPLLLDQAVGDTRPLHSSPDHPLRLVADWVKGAMTGSVEVSSRRRLVLDAALDFGAKGGDFATAVRAASNAFTAEFEVTSVDPGMGRTMTIRIGLLSVEEIGAQLDLWERLASALRGRVDVPWPELLQMAHRLAYPSIEAGERSPQALREARRVAGVILHDIALLAESRPGVVSEVRATALGIGLNFDFDEDTAYELLHGELDWRHHESEGQRLSEGLGRLAADWGASSPGEITRRLDELQREANAAGARGSRAPVLCELLAQRVANPEQWLAAVTSTALPTGCARPFMSAADEQHRPSWEGLVMECLAKPSMRQDAVSFVLTHLHTPNDLLGAALASLSGCELLVEVHVVRHEVPESTLRRILDAEGTVAEAAVVGMWDWDAGDGIPDSLREAWEKAAVRSLTDGYWAGEILAQNPALAERWLVRKLRENDGAMLRYSDHVGKVVIKMDARQRMRVLSQISRTWGLRGLVQCLVADDIQLYDMVLETPDLAHLRVDPLRREPSEAWARLVESAVRHGLARDSIVGAALYPEDIGVLLGPESEHIAKRLEEFIPWARDTRPEVREVAATIVMVLQADLARARREERTEEERGWE